MFTLKKINSRYNKEVCGTSFPIIEVTAKIDGEIKSGIKIAPTKMIKKLFSLPEGTRVEIAEKIYSFCSDDIFSIKCFEQLKLRLDAILA